MHYAPTPIQFLETFQNNNIYIKREDLLPFSFGGNKLRIADAFFADMQAEGGNHIVAYGPPTSNLCRVIANRAASLRLPCTIVCGIEGEAPKALGNNARMLNIFGAELRYCQKSEVASTIEALLAEIRQKGQVPYYIYGNAQGKGKEAVACSAYARLFPEILAQEKELGLHFDSIALAMGTGMTYAGLLAGKIQTASTHKLVAYSVARSSEQALPYVQSYVNSLVPCQDEHIHIVDDYCLSYGQHNPAIAQCIERVLAQTGIALDPIYTGKAYWGLLSELSKTRLEGQNILFLHTGGAPLFFDHLKEV